MGMGGFAKYGNELLNNIFNNYVCFIVNIKVMNNIIKNRKIYMYIIGNLTYL